MEIMTDYESRKTVTLKELAENELARPKILAGAVLHGVIARTCKEQGNNDSRVFGEVDLPCDGKAFCPTTVLK